jgi:hypothetical protein
VDDYSPSLPEALAVGMGNNLEGGSRNFFRGESFYNLASNIDDIGSLARAASRSTGKLWHTAGHDHYFTK